MFCRPFNIVNERKKIFLFNMQTVLLSTLLNRKLAPINFLNHYSGKKNFAKFVQGEIRWALHIWWKKKKKACFQEVHENVFKGLFLLNIWVGSNLTYYYIVITLFVLKSLYVFSLEKFLFLYCNLLTENLKDVFFFFFSFYPPVKFKYYACIYTNK